MKMGFTLRKSFGAPGNAQSPAFVFTERGKGNRGGAEKKNIQNSINKTWIRMLYETRVGFTLKKR